MAISKAVDFLFGEGQLRSASCPPPSNPSVCTFVFILSLFSGLNPFPDSFRALFSHKVVTEGGKEVILFSLETKLRSGDCPNSSSIQRALGQRIETSHSAAPLRAEPKVLEGRKLQREGLRFERGVRPPNRQLREALLSFPPGNEEARLALLWCGLDLDWRQQQEWVTSSTILLWCLRRGPAVWPNGSSSRLAFAGWGLGMLKPSPQLLG